MKPMTCLLIILLAAATALANGPAFDLARAREVTEWVHAHIAYVSTPDVIKTPAATLITGGDCADMSALVIWLLEDEGIHAAMLLLDLDGFVEHHAVVVLYGRIFDATTGRMYREAFPLPHRVVESIGLSNLLADWEGSR